MAGVGHHRPADVNQTKGRAFLLHPFTMHLSQDKMWEEGAKRPQQLRADQLPCPPPVSNEDALS